VVAAIALGGVLQLVFVALGHRHLPAETLVRYSLFGTLVFYGAVLMMISTQLRRDVGLRWLGAGSRASSIAIGVAVGGGLAGVFSIVIAKATGSVTTDPGIALLTSEGDLAHIVATVLITVVAAPVVEEMLFRGLFAESLRQYGTRVAIIASSLAFAVWHFRPAELRYYAVMGALLGALYMKRGLVCSMSAHASFNGVLTAIAIWLAVAPGHPVVVGDLQVDAPSGWHRPAVSSSSGVAPSDEPMLTGPSGAEVLVMTLPMRRPMTAEDIVARESALAASVPDGVNVDVASARVEHLPLGDAATVDVTARGESGQLVMLPRGGVIYMIVFESQGSAKAGRDFDRMLSSARVASS
jgi:membrane protease YdiL (CAAX protease family)